MEMEKLEMWHEKKDVDEQGVERVRQSEKMVKFLSLAKNIPAFKGKSVEEVFSSEESKRDFIENLNEADFVELVRGINALLRGKEIDSPEMEWAFMRTGGGLGQLSETFSHKRDKPELYSFLHNAMQEMNQNKKSVEEIALLCGVSINVIHGFSDGNGRTSRFVYSMLNNNFDNDLKKELREILTQNGRDVIDIDPYYIARYIDKLIEKEIGIKRAGKNKTTFRAVIFEDPDVFKEKMSDQDFKEFISSMDDNERYILYSILDCFKNKKDINKYSYHGKNKSLFDAGLFFEDLNKEEIKQVIERFWELKKRKAKIFIDCIANPNKDEYQIEEEGKKYQMKDILEKKITEESAEYKKQRAVE